MHLENDVRAFRDQPRLSRLQFIRHASWNINSHHLDSARELRTCRCHHRVAVCRLVLGRTIRYTGPGIGHILRSRRPYQHDNVMHHGSVSGPDLHLLHPLVLGETGRHDDVRIIHGFRDLPALCTRPASGSRRRACPWPSLRRTSWAAEHLSGRPLSAALSAHATSASVSSLDKRPIVTETAVLRIGKPRRHLAHQHGSFDRFGPRPRIP